MTKITGILLRWDLNPLGHQDCPIARDSYFRSLYTTLEQTTHDDGITLNKNIFLKSKSDPKTTLIIDS